MNLKTKRSKELLYVIIFLVAAIAWFYFNPLDLIRDLIELSPNELSIKYTLLSLGMYPIFSNVANIAVYGSIFFLLCFMYSSTRAIRRHL